MQNLSAMYNPSLLHAASVLVCVLLVVGVLARRKKRAHIPFMVAAIGIDLAIVLIIEFGRGAIASAEAKMGTLMIVHIAMSVLVLVLYGVQVVTGIKKARGQSSPIHGKVMPWLLALRLGNLFTSFLVMQ